MSDTKPTPGPWTFDEHGGTFYIFAPSGMVADGHPDCEPGLARIRGVGRGATIEEQRANARLMSAAPDLLAALGACITALSFEGEQAAARGDEIALRQIHAAREGAYAAIAKAEGR